MTTVPIPDRACAWILEAPEHLSWQEVPVPTPEGGDVLVKVEAALTCGTDLKAFRRGHPQIPMPGPFGHEYAGTVAAAGPAAMFKPGEPVYGVHTAPCGTCAWCRRGQENLCESIMATKVLGTFAEYVLIPERIAKVHLFRRPDTLRPAEAALIEPLACVMQSISHLCPQPEDSIAVIGPGAIGFLFGLALRAIGCQQVTIFGRTPERLSLGKTLGLDCRPLEEVKSTSPYRAVIECTGSLDVWESSVSWVERGGKAVLFGGLPSGSRPSFDASRLHYDQIDLISPFHFGGLAVRAAKELLESGRIQAGPLITAHRPLAELPLALDDLNRRVGLKYALIP